MGDGLPRPFISVFPLVCLLPKVIFNSLLSEGDSEKRPKSNLTLVIPHTSPDSAFNHMSISVYFAPFPLRLSALQACLIGMVWRRNARKQQRLSLLPENWYKKRFLTRQKPESKETPEMRGCAILRLQIASQSVFRCCSLDRWE